LHQVIDEAFMREAYRRTRKSGAKGVDGEGAAEFAAQLPERLVAMREGLVRGTYRAPPVRRVHISKGSGRKTRPIGIPTFEDKVMHRAVGMVVEAVYEQDFLPCSYGYRPKRSAHDALLAVREGLMEMGGGYVVELDIERFFDTLRHSSLRAFLSRRMTDGVLRRAIDRWLAAGVLENGKLHYPEDGTPQGGVISPLLANIYLHEVLDVWFEREVKPRLRGRGFMVRYADDAVMAFEREEDARRVLAVLPKRFERFGLRLHPEKTRLLLFKRPRLRDNGRDDCGRRESFDFLGLTQHWARSRRNYWVIKRRTAKDRFSRAVRQVTLWCKQHRHDPVAHQHERLSAKLRGHYAYFGITGNQHALARFYEAVQRSWYKWLSRRSGAARQLLTRFCVFRVRWPLPLPIAIRSILSRSANPCL
jgi:group II intron reverse transcriptase/maturase